MMTNWLTGNGLKPTKITRTYRRLHRPTAAESPNKTIEKPQHSNGDRRYCTKETAVSRVQPIKRQTFNGWRSSRNKTPRYGEPRRTWSGTHLLKCNYYHQTGQSYSSSLGSRVVPHRWDSGFSPAWMPTTQTHTKRFGIQCGFILFLFSLTCSFSHRNIEVSQGVSWRFV